ncbi:MAG: type VI secretion system tip protein VgrG [Desulfobacterium sp.]|nr:type VI secretion system tip protein VgrG [Desulfobacterium sp.]
MPNTSLKVTSDTIHALGPGEREKYDYPGGYIKRNAGDTLSVLRMEEEETRITTVSGISDCRAFTTGHRFRLENSFQDDWTDKDYLLTHITHRADQAATYASESSIPKPEKIYTNEFKCIPYEVPFRPPISTPIPVVEGVQTAVTVGPAGEEIYTDAFGRVKVQFHWDREGQLNEHSSCWLRVSQSMAGLGWGAVILPRVGHEVIVEFIEGNPDRPIVTGQVYHGTNRPPYGLPGEKTKSTFKSNSSPGGGGFNEIRLEDKAGSEEIYFHGQKDWDIVMENDKSQKIGNNETVNESVVGLKAEEVGISKMVAVAGDFSETVGNTHKLKAKKIVIEADEEITFKTGAASIVLTSDGTITIKGTQISQN